MLAHVFPLVQGRLAQAELQSRAEHAASMSASAARHAIPHETIERPAPRPLHWAVSGSAPARLSHCMLSNRLVSLFSMQTYILQTYKKHVRILDLT